MLPNGWNWIVVMGLVVLFLTVLGSTVTGRSLGIFINERKLMSLSRFQFVLWTVIVISAYLVIALARVKGESVADPLVVQIDWQVWSLLGISAASLVGSPWIGSSKKQKQPRDKKQFVKRLQIAYGNSKAELDDNREGILYGNRNVSEARFTDMFEGDELGNTQYIDLAKVQMFLFTVIVAVSYGVQVFNMIMFNDLLADNIALPSIHEGLLTLMGISHAGYLGNKGIDHTPTTP
jgi:hypothetical protein